MMGCLRSPGDFSSPGEYSKMRANFILGGFACGSIHQVTESHLVNIQKNTALHKKTRSHKHLITRLLLHLEKIDIT